MGSIFSKPPKPTPPPPLPPAAVAAPVTPPSEIDPAVVRAKEESRKKATSQGANKAGTILTTPQGLLSTASTTKKTVLGV